MQKYGYFCKSKVVDINLDNGLLQSAKIKTLANHAIIAAHFITNNQSCLRLFKLYYDEKINQYCKESIILFQELQMSSTSNCYKLTRNLEQLIFANQNEHLIIFDLKSQAQQIQQTQPHHFIQNFKLIKNSTLIAYIINNTLSQPQSLEIRNYKLMSNLVQKIDLKYTMNWESCQLLSFSFQGIIGTFLQFFQFDDRDYLIKIFKMRGPKGKQTQIFINSFCNQKFEIKIAELNTCCDLLLVSSTVLDSYMIKLFNQSKLIRNQSIQQQMLFNSFNSYKQEVQIICRNLKGVIFYTLDMSTGILNQTSPHFNNAKRQVLLTHLFNRIYLENFGDEYEKYEEPKKVDYSSIWNLLN